MCCDFPTFLAHIDQLHRKQFGPPHLVLIIHNICALVMYFPISHKCVGFKSLSRPSGLFRSELVCGSVDFIDSRTAWTGD
jgi:hypothetical protein